MTLLYFEGLGYWSTCHIYRGAASLSSCELVVQGTATAVSLSLTTSFSVFTVNDPTCVLFHVSGTSKIQNQVSIAVTYSNWHR